MSVVASRHEFCRIARLVYFDEATPRQLAAKRELDEILEADDLRAALVAPPVREPGMQGFCRRCHAQVMRDSGDCPDCVVVPITPFDGTSTGERRVVICATSGSRHDGLRDHRVRSDGR